MPIKRLLFLVLTVLAALSNISQAQEPADDSTALAPLVFLDCNGPGCDFDHFRREITWVNWVRDRQDAEVHLLVTVEQTGGGGWSYTLDYIGRRALQDIQKTLSYVSDPTDTDAEVREGLTQTMAVGLVQFVESTSLAPRLRIVYDQPAAMMNQSEEQDPWNLWVFRVGLDGSIEGEAQQSTRSVEWSTDADRVSETLKINFGVSGEYDREEFEFDEDTVIDVSERYSADLLMVWSLGDHWSLGGKVGADRSTFLNYDLAGSFGPTVEYNVFPYHESTRRQVTFRYSVELAAFDYELETLELKTSEVLPRHSLVASTAVQQPWGQIDASVEGIQYFHDLATHRINTFLNFEYRLFRGFSLDVFGRFSRIKDQFYLPREDLSEEEVLLERRQRETDYQFDIGVGFSYRFGSKFANIVNPRMRGGGGRGRHR